MSPAFPASSNFAFIVPSLSPFVATAPRTEIYIEVCLVMDTAEVPYQDIIYKYPYIVITAEFISYILSARSLCRLQDAGNACSS